MNFTALLQLDARSSAALRLKQEKNSLWYLSSFLAHSGDSWFWMAGLGLFWLFSRGAWQYWAALLGFGIVILAVVVQAVKYIIRRQRPPGEWGAIYRNTDPHSFPSGHAARAAMLAVMACLLGPSWFGVLVVLWAPLVCLARVAMGVHYLSDVLAGIVVGLVAGWAVVQFQAIPVAVFPFFFYPHLYFGWFA